MLLISNLDSYISRNILFQFLLPYYCFFNLDVFHFFFASFYLIHTCTVTQHIVSLNHPYLNNAIMILKCVHTLFAEYLIEKFTLCSQIHTRNTKQGQSSQVSRKQIQSYALTLKLLFLTHLRFLGAEVPS